MRMRNAAALASPALLVGYASMHLLPYRLSGLLRLDMCKYQ